MDESLKTILYSALFSSLTGLSVWFIQSKIEELNHAKERLHQEKRQVYSEILEPFIKAFSGIKNPQQTQEALSLIQSYEYRKTAIEFSLVGDDEVVQAYNDLMQFSFRLNTPSGSNEPATDLLRYYGGVLLAVRRSIGHSETELSELDMLRNQITDIDQLLKSKR